MSFDPSSLSGWSDVFIVLPVDLEIQLRLLCLQSYSSGVADMLEKASASARQVALDSAVREAISDGERK